MVVRWVAAFQVLTSVTAAVYIPWSFKYRCRPPMSVGCPQNQPAAARRLGGGRRGIRRVDTGAIQTNPTPALYITLSPIRSARKQKCTC